MFWLIRLGSDPGLIGPNGRILRIFGLFTHPEEVRETMSRLPTPDVGAKKNGMKVRNAVMVGFTLPVLLLYVSFFLVVMILGVYYSMTNWTGIAQTFDFIGLKNYTTVLQDSRFWKAIWFNIRYAVMLVIGVILISLLIALALNKLKGKVSTLFRSIFFIPAVLSLVTVGLIWNELFLRAFPPMGEALGIEWLSKSILGSPNTAIFGILIVNLWQGCATPTVLLLAGLQSVPADLYEAATIDGANAWQKFKNITVPFLIPIITMLVITITKGGLTIFDYIQAMTAGGPAQSTEAIGILIYRHAMSEGKFAQSVAESMLLFVIVAMVSFLTIKLSSKKEVGDDA